MISVIIVPKQKLKTDAFHSIIITYLTRGIYFVIHKHRKVEVASEVFDVVGGRNIFLTVYKCRSLQDVP